VSKDARLSSWKFAQTFVADSTRLLFGRTVVLAPSLAELVEAAGEGRGVRLQAAEIGRRPTERGTAGLALRTA
jgi:hypothetical protein